jgi:putative hemolysin
MNAVLFEIFILLILIMANGIFSMSEMSVVSASEARLQQRANAGDRKARNALKLANAPERFVTTIQIGITLIGILTGAFGEATIAEKLTGAMSIVPAIEPYSETLSLIIVVICITYVSVVMGELVPKRLALKAPEQIASTVAGPMRLLSRFASPVVSLLNFSTNAVLRLFGVRDSSESPASEEEIQVLINQSTEAGILEVDEQKIVERAFRLDDQPINALMTARRRIFWLDIERPQQENLNLINNSFYSRFPVCQGELDNVVGIVKIKELFTHCVTDTSVGLTAVMRQPLFVHENVKASQTLELFKQSKMHLALIVDEYGVIQGLVTLNDILQALVGYIPPDEALIEPQAVQQEDGSWLLDGMLPISDFKALFDLEELPDEKKNTYHSMGGFVIAQLGGIPTTTDYFDWNNFRLEVINMDSNRVDKVRVTPITCLENKSRN